MALGIDSEGHKGALEGKMPTFAVLGSGVDVCYPKSNRKLYERILWENGGIISECPLGSGPVSWHFPPPKVNVLRYRHAKNNFRSTYPLLFGSSFILLPPFPIYFDL